MVALYLRAWIEIRWIPEMDRECSVALYLRAWIEILLNWRWFKDPNSRSLLESVD